MKKFFALIFLIVQLSLSAQIQDPVKWNFEQRKLNAEQLELRFVADIESGWHLYDISMQEDSPVLPTTFTFEDMQGASLVGGMTSQNEAQSMYDRNFGVNLNYYSGQVTFVQKVQVADSYHISGNVRFMACNDETCLAPTARNFEFASEEAALAVSPLTQLQMPTVQIADGKVEKDGLPAYWSPVTDEEGAEAYAEVAENSFWRIFFDGFLAGLLALFTPCVWPIIPLTVSFFLKRRRGKRDAFMYGASIVIIYTFVGMLVTYLFNASSLNALSTSAVFNIFCFLLLVVFAASFLGMFEITLPSSWSTRLDAKAEKKGGVIGVFLMAATLALVSFSCTGPIVGTLLVALSVDGAFLAPMIGMLGFSVALAGPFTLFALFPRWLDAMPKSGGWMNAVKVTLGILELAFALKFLSVADLAYGWHILDREVFLSLWIVLFSMLGLYYIGKIRFAHEAELKNVSFFRFFLALLSFAFAIYMLPGLWGAPLKAVSAFAPPLTTQDFKLGNAEGNVFYDYDEGMAYARQHDKKVFLDFSGYGCVNCRKMEAAVFADAEVKKMLNDNFVVVTLYVDDRTALPQEMEVQENGASVRLQTQGEKWSFLQRYKFGTNAQPYYVVLDKDGKTYGGSFAYNESVTDFVAFLRKNLEKE